MVVTKQQTSSIKLTKAGHSQPSWVPLQCPSVAAHAKPVMPGHASDMPGSDGQVMTSHLTHENTTLKGDEVIIMVAIPTLPSPASLRCAIDSITDRVRHQGRRCVRSAHHW